MKTDEFKPRPGALRAMREDGTYGCANPGDALFSTVTMVATEYYTLGRGWVKIFDDEEQKNADRT